KWLRVYEASRLRSYLGGTPASGRVSRIADWPRLFGHIITATGWTKREVEALTLREANELLEYWSEHPPTHVLLAATMRVRPLRKKDLASAVAGLGGTVASQPSLQMKKLLKKEHAGHKGTGKVTGPAS